MAAKKEQQNPQEQVYIQNRGSASVSPSGVVGGGDGDGMPTEIETENDFGFIQRDS